MSYYTHWIAILTFLIQLGLGAVAYGRLEGRVTGIETEVHMLLERSLAKP